MPALFVPRQLSDLTGVLTVAAGGTGQTSQQAAIDALAGAQSAGKYLRSDGTHTTLTTIQAGDVPTLNQNTTGTAANVSGTVALANGGTGQTTAAAAINALVPAQASNSGKVLGTNGTAVSWVSGASAGVASVAGTANQVIASASTGAVTLSLPQSIDTSSAVQFASLVTGGAAPAGVPSWATKIGATGTTGTQIVVEDIGGSGAGLVAKGSNEADLILQHTGATSGQQCFYFRNKGGNWDVINLSDNLAGINNYIVSWRYDGRMTMGLGSANTNTAPATLTLGASTSGVPALQARPASGQTVDVAQFTDSTGSTVVSGVEKGGALFVATGSGAPATTPKDGTLYLDTTNNKLYARTGGAWKSVTLT